MGLVISVGSCDLVFELSHIPDYVLSAPLNRWSQLCISTYVGDVQVHRSFQSYWHASQHHEKTVHVLPNALTETCVLWVIKIPYRRKLLCKHVSISWLCSCSSLLKPSNTYIAKTPDCYKRSAQNEKGTYQQSKACHMSQPHALISPH